MHDPLQSGIHDPIVSGNVHVGALSGLHDQLLSAAHTAADSLLHDPIASGFHDPAVSGIHSALLSGAHNPILSGGHDPIDSAVHVPAISAFQDAVANSLLPPDIHVDTASAEVRTAQAMASCDAAALGGAEFELAQLDAVTSLGLGYGEAGARLGTLGNCLQVILPADFVFSGSWDPPPDGAIFDLGDDLEGLILAEIDSELPSALEGWNMISCCRASTWTSGKASTRSATRAPTSGRRTLPPR